MVSGALEPGTLNPGTLNPGTLNSVILEPGAREGVGAGWIEDPQGRVMVEVIA